MTEKQFLKALRKALRGLPAAERKDALSYYSELIHDSMESGMTEQDAVASLGSVEEIAAGLLGEASGGGKRSASAGGRGAVTAAVIIGSPIWLSLLIAALACAIAVICVLLSLVAAFFAMLLGLISGFIIGVISFFFMVWSNPIAAFFQLGASIFALGLAFLMLLAVRGVALGLASGVKAVISWPKKLLARRGGKVNG